MPRNPAWLWRDVQTNNLNLTVGLFLAAWLFGTAGWLAHTLVEIGRCNGN